MMRNQGHRPHAVVASLVLALSICQPAAAKPGVSPLVRGRGCERSHERQLTFSKSARADTLAVRATGPSCGRVSIVVTLRDGSHRLLWNERTYLAQVESDQLPGEPANDVPFEHVIAAVEHWVSVENTSEAPPWPDGASRSGRPQPGTQYDTKLDRRRYERIRAARAAMVCIPIGPESAHCIAIDPATRKPVEFLGRGL
jgi:hypothetical protein